MATPLKYCGRKSAPTLPTAPTGTVTNLLPPYVLRLDHAQPPSTLAPKVGACRFLRPRWTHCHPAFAVATVPKVCSAFAVFVSISRFASACAVVLLPSIFPSHESFAGVFASRRRNGCAKSFGGSRCCFVQIKLPNRFSGFEESS